MIEHLLVLETDNLLHYCKQWIMEVGLVAEITCQCHCIWFLTINTVLPRRLSTNKVLHPFFLLSSISNRIITPFIRNMACHQRSASLPSELHSTVAKVEEEIQGLRARISSPSVTIDTMRDGFMRLGCVYNSIEQIMCLPSNQVGLSSPQRRMMVEEELDRCLVLIDLCNAMQEYLSELKMSILELQLVLKRCDAAAAAAQLKFESFVRMARKAQKPFKKTSSKATAECCNLIRLMEEDREMAVSLLDSTSALLLKKIGTPSSSKWSLVSTRFWKGKVICEEEQFQGLKSNIGDLEIGAELLFRRLIQTRVFLLNSLSS